MRNVRTYLASLLAFSFLLLGAGAMMPSNPVFAACSDFPQNRTACEICDGSGGTFVDGVCTRPGEKEFVGENNSLFRSIVNILLFIVGAISVIMLIVGGIRFVVSSGDASQVQSARNTIIYSLVGVVVAFMAFAMVNFVVGRLESSPPPADESTEEQSSLVLPERRTV